MSGGGPVPVPVKANSKHEVMLCIEDIEKVGSAKLEPGPREFFNSGSTSQQTIRENSSAFLKYRLRSRCLVDVSKLSMKTTVFDRDISLPLGISPAGIQGMAHPDGELATSRACAAMGVSMAISSFSNYPLADVANAGGGKVSHAMQLYPMKNRELQEKIVRDAEAAGCKGIFLTADSPVLGVRYNEWRNDFRTPEGLGFPNMGWTTEKIRQQTHDSGFMTLNDYTSSLTKEIPWLRERTKMQIWIKGVVTAEDTLLAIQHGCDGILVSNHGGRQLDGVPAAIDAMVECVEAAQGRIPIHVDGGFRKGSDIFIALALGAKCVWIGRPVLWGLAYDGQKGVEKVIEILSDEFRRCMALCGCNRVEDITRNCLARIDHRGMLARL